MTELQKYPSIAEALTQIRQIVEHSRKQLAQSVNAVLLQTYWDVGKIIVDVEQAGQPRADYGKHVLREFARDLSRDLGKGFSRSNLQNMRNFYLAYPNCQTVSGNLSWSHYCELLGIAVLDKRAFYEKECVQSNWSVRELKRQIKTSLFERLLLSEGNANKQKVLKLAQVGQTIQAPADVLKDPYVFEFLALPEQKPVLEKDLHQKLLRHLEAFLTDKNEVMAEYALGGISNQIFALRYVPYIPDKEALIRQVELMLQAEAMPAGEEKSMPE